MSKRRIVKEFTILGNQEDPDGNPIPYKRVTQKSKWYGRGQRYEAWKGHVVEAFLSNLSRDERRFYEECMARHGKPVRMAEETKARLYTRIRFVNERHGDPSNIIKGIEDALFVDDKHVDLSTKHRCDADHGEVDVTLIATVTN